MADEIEVKLKQLSISAKWDDIFSTKKIQQTAKRLGGKWKELGRNLDFQDYDLENFESSAKNPQEAANAMLTKYRNKSQHYKKPAQTEELLLALRETDCFDVISFLTGEKIEEASGPAAGPTVQAAVGTADVFISYQWDKQTQIKALHKALSDQGFKCWMDIGEMGGGDSLYAEIEKGIRGCKVVISCITTNYAKSSNCQREVTLADLTKKPIIPLYLEEKMAWPPIGEMAMIFAQKLYIDFSKPEMQISWKGPKMDELVSKLNGYVK